MSKKYLKIAILNNSGNVGKSMICDTLFYPRIEGIKKIKIETINSDGTDDETTAATNIKKVFQLIDSSDLAIIDVGASNIENFMANLEMLEGSHEEIDFFFIPTTPKPKQQTDTITTINNLLDLGVESSQIKLIFNFYDTSFLIENLYPAIFDSELFDELELSEDKNLFVINDNPVFDMLGEMGFHFTEIVNDKRDFKALIRGTDDTKKRNELSHQRSAFRLSQRFTKELDQTFEKINNICKLVDLKMDNKAKSSKVS